MDLIRFRNKLTNKNSIKFSLLRSCRRSFFFFGHKGIEGFGKHLCLLNIHIMISFKMSMYVNYSNMEDSLSVARSHLPLLKFVGLHYHKQNCLLLFLETGTFEFLLFLHHCKPIISHKPIQTPLLIFPHHYKPKKFKQLANPNYYFVIKATCLKFQMNHSLLVFFSCCVLSRLLK